LKEDECLICSESATEDVLECIATHDGARDDSTQVVVSEVVNKIRL